MSYSLSDLLLLYAQQFEDQHAPQNMTIALREAAKELDRLRAGGCARDQSTTQYCAEAARLVEENERLRATLERIASWDEGSTVNGTFDEPYSAKIARAALKEPRT
jgi:hypothetical protein